MPSDKPIILPVQTEIKQIARSSLAIAKKLSENFKLAAITLWFYDDEAAELATECIRLFHDQRIGLNQKIDSQVYCVTASPNERGSLIEMRRNSSQAVLPYDDFIPPEYIELLDTIYHTRLQKLPIDPYLGESFDSFQKAFRPLTAIWTFYHASDTIAFMEETLGVLEKVAADATDVTSARKLRAIKSKEFYLPAIESILDLHENFLKIASLIQNAGLEVLPMVIIP